MADHRLQHRQRLVLAYQPQGFQQVGGLQRVAQELVQYLTINHPGLALATLTEATTGQLEGTERTQRLRGTDRLLILGCDRGWAYVLACLARLRRIAVYWLPSFHDPRSAIHPGKARLAQYCLRAMQRIGVVVYVQTIHEQTLLAGKQPTQCRLSSHALPATIRAQLQAKWTPPIHAERPIDLLFLGRPSPQKGWPLFLAMASRSNLCCQAILPTLPQGGSAQELKIHLHPSDKHVQELLLSTKLVMIPAIYESFGIAQLEALSCGCLVPILGHWPLWDDFALMQWQAKSLQQLLDLCERLCANDGLRQRLQLAQWTYLQKHPILSIPILPGLR